MADLRSFRLGAPGADDSKRSPDEVRIIKEMVSEEVDAFLLANNIDAAASRDLRKEPPHVALAVLERGPLRACANPSGALVGRIRDAKRGVLGNRGQYGGVPPPSSLDGNTSEVDKFLISNGIDQAGIASFRSEAPDIQKLVMAKGNFINTANPSASLMARIRTVKMDLASGAPTLGGAEGAGTGAAGGPMQPGLPPGMGMAPGLANILGIPPGQQAPAGLGGGMPPPPSMALEDSSRPAGAFQTGPAGAIQTGSLDAEARRAIEKLNFSMAQDGAAAPPSAATQPGGAQSFASSEEKALQDEAFRVIQSLNG
ncbi:unnamed protein product [Prorocentrum cordatum]|uniref:Uncharacterized protein n=1 Tax=Prorocentrum cordatum TaxID=2364126 RepID=A0ABN9TWD3_9DINO|nr:unnamed protein product [Polarella glacialis]